MAIPTRLNAVIFALRRLREGVCIFADEVGLGKTIEADLVKAKWGPAVSTDSLQVDAV